LEGHDNFVNSVSFSPDGKTLASGSADKTIKLWNLGTDWGLSDLMGRSCDWVRAYLESNIKVSESDKHLCDGIGTQK
jgi:WD40 repeat protein